ncbi:hypothetical protein BpHYR1_017228 [Brachionus plicatilis]|uniref:Uncharacterized protein n=1 Tax=Brachionus plicatilis TaxID=10195 RepID=A0A3M7QS59_BRAPC|nr:hypothetical protein BpHYR1_017228 [Brachionus plicatilis]
MEPVKYVKETDTLELNIQKSDYGNIVKEVEIDLNKPDPMLENYEEKRLKQNNLNIAPTFIPDRRIKKPEGKEPKAPILAQRLFNRILDVSRRSLFYAINFWIWTSCPNKFYHGPLVIL